MINIYRYIQKFIPVVYIGVLLFFFCSADGFAYNRHDADDKIVVITAEKQFQLARTLFEEKDFSAAAYEYIRFYHLFPNSAKTAHARYNAGLSFFNAGRFKDAIRHFKQISAEFSDSGFVPDAMFKLSESYIATAQPHRAVSVLRNLITLTSDVKVRDRACFILGWMLLDKAELFKSQSDYKVYPVRDAKKYFSMISPAGKNRYQINDTIRLLEKINHLKKKNPKMAGILSIIPGGGFLYCERYQDAFVSFLLNSSLILAAYKAFENDNNYLGGVISFVETGFYTGNIYGSITSAHKYNKKKQKEFIYKLKQRYVDSKSKISLHTGFLNKGFALMFKYNF